LAVVINTVHSVLLTLIADFCCSCELQDSDVHTYLLINDGVIVKYKQFDD